jgi:mono/diheme cytochrome c family protein
MVKRLALVVLLLIAFVSATLLVYVRSTGLSARPVPSGAEAFVARSVRSFAIPGDARQAKNPVASDATVLSQAMAHFADHCSICHANDGSGGSPIGQGLYPKPPDLRANATQSLTDGELYWIIHNGIRFTGMPAFGDDKPGAVDEDSWKLVHFIRHLPRITEEELQTMKQHNPKSRAELEEEEQIRRFLAGEDTIVPAGTHHD